jgi:hypothetical protein
MSCRSRLPRSFLFSAASQLLAYWPFNEGVGTSVADQSGYKQSAIIVNPAPSNWVVGPVSNAIFFDQSLSIPSYVQLTKFNATVKSNFSFTLWVKPTAQHQIDPETNTGVGGVTGQRYVVDSLNGSDVSEDPEAAGVGLSVGLNGVSVYEHAANYMPAILVYQTQILDWTHIAVVYTQNKPVLYVNGVLVHSGLQSTYTSYFLPRMLANSYYGNYVGGLDEVRMYSRSLQAADIAQLYATDLAQSRFLCVIQFGHLFTLILMSLINHA